MVARAGLIFIGMISLKGNAVAVKRVGWAKVRHLGGARAQHPKAKYDLTELDC